MSDSVLSTGAAERQGNRWTGNAEHWDGEAPGRPIAGDAELRNARVHRGTFSDELRFCVGELWALRAGALGR